MAFHGLRDSGQVRISQILGHQTYDFSNILEHCPYHIRKESHLYEPISSQDLQRLDGVPLPSDEGEDLLGYLDHDHHFLSLDHFGVDREALSVETYLEEEGEDAFQGAYHGNSWDDAGVRAYPFQDEA